ncbi:Alpha/Beta hydrolase protein [Catenaria anguillulae PL171]|uniref:Alpha/Beta hydrolase protein n=1 Tax=Catenaria anguillulae PL171 TaxID=765915 RepID=A0A1Y2HP58_9FUNG|nr:Alpha/Beta hydrolase protein [Catenaria anguillulae PL171]
MPDLSFLPDTFAQLLPTGAHSLLVHDLVSILFSTLLLLALLTLAILVYLNWGNRSCPLVLHSVSPQVLISTRNRRPGQPSATYTLREYLDLTCPSLSTPFTPTFWLPIGHLQTFYASLGTIDGTASYQRDFLPMPDGGQVAIDWSKPHPLSTTPYQEDTTTIVVLHGLTGGSHESYVQDIVHYLTAPPRNYRCVVVNFRGCADSELLTPQLYNGAYTDDFRRAIEYIRKCVPKAKLGAVGYSLGSNVLVKYLGEEGDKAVFKAAVSVCNPFDFLASAEEIMSTPLKRVYSRALANNLKQAYLRHAKMISSHPQVRHDRVMASKYVWEFDDRVTRVVFGYHTVEDYYRAASSCNYIDRVRVPLFCHNSLDDPISPLRAIPFTAADANPWVTIGTTRLGGHIGHFNGNWRPKRWSTAVYGEYLVAMLEADEVVVMGDACDVGVDVEVDVARAQVEQGQAVERQIQHQDQEAEVGHDRPRHGTKKRVARSAADSAISTTSTATPTSRAAPTNPSAAAPLASGAVDSAIHTDSPAVPTTNTNTTTATSTNQDERPTNLRAPTLIGSNALKRYFGSRSWMLPFVKWLIEHATGSKALAVVLALLGLRRVFVGRM